MVFSPASSALPSSASTSPSPRPEPDLRPAEAQHADFHSRLAQCSLFHSPSSPVKIDDTFLRQPRRNHRKGQIETARTREKHAKKGGKTNLTQGRKRAKEDMQETILRNPVHPENPVNPVYCPVVLLVVLLFSLFSCVLRGSIAMGRKKSAAARRLAWRCSGVYLPKDLSSRQMSRS